MNRFTEPAVDVHQHLWPPALVEALRARDRPPRLEGWRLHLTGEPAQDIDPAGHDPDARAAIAADDGLGLVLVSLSAPLGIESLPAAEAEPLLRAWHDGAQALPSPFRAWASAGLDRIDTGGLERRLGEGFVGLQLPATALAGEAGYRHVAPLLDVLEEADRPLLVHPGPANASPAVPGWWPATVSYVAQMHAAWFAFHAWGRPRHPGLKVCFTMLAGLAPVHGERAAARGAPRTALHENVFLEISSYGPRAVDAAVRVVGIDALVNGSDRPYAEPVAIDGAAAAHAIRHTNPSRLLNPKEVLDDLAVPAHA